MNKQLVYNKLYNKPTKLKSKKVSLSKVDELKDQYNGQKAEIVELVLDTINSLSLAQENLNSIAELGTMDYFFVHLEDIYDSVNSLGLDEPSELKELREGVENIEYQTSDTSSLSEKINNIESKLSSIYNNIS